MNDFEFGNQMFALRKERGLSQSELGKMVGVSNKAVSKWENGNAKPNTDTLKKLADLFQMPIDSLLKSLQDKPAQKTAMIVITGGPCAGKSTAMSWVQNAFTQKGYTVLFIAETASELITGGVTPVSCVTNADFQNCLLGLQIAKERTYVEAAQRMDVKKVLIVCDRGALDNKAYMSSIEFCNVLNKLDTNEVSLRDNYDAVFHLVTAANGAEKFYTLANNKARSETPEQAREIDDKIIAAWTGHPHLRVIDNATGFEEKMRRLVKEISSFLGEPEPLEIERKYLIRFPNIKQLESMPNCQKIDILQTYLKTGNESEEVRIRQRGFDNHYIYFKTVKRDVSGLTRVETEERLSKDEYLLLLMDADQNYRQIRKTRYCLTYDNKYFEIDIYPFWDDKAIAEIELSSEDETVKFPDFLEIIKEVTLDESYKNKSLAKIGGVPG